VGLVVSGKTQGSILTKGKNRQEVFFEKHLSLTEGGNCGGFFCRTQGRSHESQKAVRRHEGKGGSTLRDSGEHCDSERTITGDGGRKGDHAGKGEGT